MRSTSARRLSLQQTQRLIADRTRGPRPTAGQGRVTDVPLFTNGGLRVDPSVRCGRRLAESSLYMNVRYLRVAAVQMSSRKRGPTAPDARQATAGRPQECT